MRLQIQSDLHNEFHRGNAPDLLDVGADVLILAGDIDNGVRGIEWGGEQAQRLGIPCVYVAGNHEFYRYDFAQMMDALYEESRAREVYFLQCGDAEINGQRFVGATLWSDFMGIGLSRRDEAMQAAQASINDYRLIGGLTPRITAEFYRHTEDYLLETVKPTDVVITHHGHSRFCHDFKRWGEPDAISASFWSKADDVMRMLNPRAWVYGHTHSNLRFKIGETQVVTNQRGYPNEDVEGYRADYIVEV